jgi:hypothetical protein
MKAAAAEKLGEKIGGSQPEIWREMKAGVAAVFFFFLRQWRKISKRNQKP